MIRKFIIDIDDDMDGHIPCLRERDSEFKKWLSDTQPGTILLGQTSSDHASFVSRTDQILTVVFLLFGAL
jgi:hypothetical protein